MGKPKNRRVPIDQLLGGYLILAVLKIWAAHNYHLPYMDVEGIDCGQHVMLARIIAYYYLLNFSLDPFIRHLRYLSLQVAIHPRLNVVMKTRGKNLLEGNHLFICYFLSKSQT